MRPLSPNTAAPAGDPDYPVSTNDLQEIHKRRIEEAQAQAEAQKNRAQKKKHWHV